MENKAYRDNQTNRASFLEPSGHGSGRISFIRIAQYYFPLTTRMRTAYVQYKSKSQEGTPIQGVRSWDVNLANRAQRELV